MRCQEAFVHILGSRKAVAALAAVLDIDPQCRAAEGRVQRRLIAAEIGRSRRLQARPGGVVMGIVGHQIDQGLAKLLAIGVFRQIEPRLGIETERIEARLVDFVHDAAIIGLDGIAAGQLAQRGETMATVDGDVRVGIGGKAARRVDQLRRLALAGIEFGPQAVGRRQPLTRRQLRTGRDQRVPIGVV